VNDTIKKDCRVSIEFENGYRIERTRNYEKNNSLKIFYKNEYLENFEKGNLKDSQRMLEEDILGINYETFIKSIICDNNVRFLISDSKLRRKMIEELLGLEKFDVLLENTKNEFKMKQQERMEMKMRMENREREIMRLLNEWKEIQLDSTDTLEIRMKEYKEMDCLLTEIKREKLNVQQDSKLEEHRNTLQMKLKYLNEKNQEGKWNELLQKIKKMKEEKEKSMQGVVLHVNEKIKILKEIQETPLSQCPICSQTFKNEIIDSNLQTLSKHGNVKDIDFHLFHLNKEMERMGMEMKSDQVEKNTILKELEFLPVTVSNIQKLNELHSREMKYSNHLLKLKYEMERLKNDSKRRERIQDSMDKMKKENEMEKWRELDREMEMLEFWSSSFQKKQSKSNSKMTLRSFLLEESIVDLNLLLKEYSEFLNSEKIISFDKELNLEQTDYGKRSSGQRKRNDLVILFALFDLVKQKGKFKSNFLCLDEVFDALDFEGKNQIHQLLNVLSQKIQKIFIISHSSEMIKGSKNIIKTTFNSTNGTSYEF
jgi:hypothetical protein